MDLDAVLAEEEPKKLTPELMQKVEDQLNIFDQWFQLPISEGGCGNEPLVNSEKALIRTFILGHALGRFPSVLMD